MDDPVTHAAWVRSALAQYECALTRYAVRLTGDVEQARDVVQDTFLRLCKADRARVDGHLAPWLYTVCRNRALDVRKKEGRMQALHETQVLPQASPDPGPGALAERNEARSLILDVVDTLPEDQQEVFRLKFQDGMTYRQIKEITGFSIAKISYLAHNGLRTIRDRLSPHFDLAAQAGGEGS